MDEVCQWSVCLLRIVMPSLGRNVAYYSQEKLAGVGGLALDGSTVVFKRRRRNSFEEQLTPK